MKASENSTNPIDQLKNLLEIQKNGGIIKMSTVIAAFQEVYMLQDVSLSEDDPALSTAANLFVEIARNEKEHGRIINANNIFGVIYDVAKNILAFGSKGNLCDILDHLNQEELNSIFKDGVLIYSAAHQNQKEIVEYLLSKGADPTIGRNSGHNAITISMSQNNYAITYILIKNQLTKSSDKKIGIMEYLTELQTISEGSAKKTTELFIEALNRKISEKNTKHNSSGEIIKATDAQPKDISLDDEDELIKLLSSVSIGEGPRKQVKATKRWGTTRTEAYAGAAAGAAAGSAYGSAAGAAAGSAYGAAAVTATEEAVVAEAIAELPQRPESSSAKRFLGAGRRITMVQRLAKTSQEDVDMGSKSQEDIDMSRAR